MINCTLLGRDTDDFFIRLPEFLLCKFIFVGIVSLVSQTLAQYCDVLSLQKIWDFAYWSSRKVPTEKLWQAAVPSQYVINVWNSLMNSPTLLRRMVQTHREVSMSCCCRGVVGTKKWGRDNKGQTFGTLNTRFDLKGSLGLTQNLAETSTECFFNNC